MCMIEGHVEYTTGGGASVLYTTECFTIHPLHLLDFSSPEMLAYQLVTIYTAATLWAGSQLTRAGWQCKKKLKLLAVYENTLVCSVSD